MKRVVIVMLVVASLVAGLAAPAYAELPPYAPLGRDNWFLPDGTRVNNVNVGAYVCAGAQFAEVDGYKFPTERTCIDYYAIVNAHSERAARFHAIDLYKYWRTAWKEWELTNDYIVVYTAFFQSWTYVAVKGAGATACFFLKEWVAKRAGKAVGTFAGTGCAIAREKVENDLDPRN